MGGGMGFGMGGRGGAAVADDEKKKIDKKALKTLLKYAVPYWPFFLTSFVMVMIITGAELLKPYIIGMAIDDYMMKAVEDPGNFEIYKSGLILSGVYYMMAVVVNFIFTYINTYLLASTSAKIIRGLRDKVFARVQRLPFTYFDKTPVGSVVTRICNDTNTISEMYQNVVVNFFRDIFTMVGIIVLMFLLDVRLTLTVLAVLPLMAFAAITFRMKARKIFTLIRAKLSAINAFLSEHIAGMQIIQAFNMENVKKKEFDNVNRDYFKANRNMIKVFGIFRPFMEVVAALATALIFWIGGRSILESGLQFGVLYMFLNYSGRFFMPIMNLTEMYNTTQASLVSSDRINSLMKMEPETNLDPVILDGIKGEIEFRNVWFAYVEDVWVLRDVSFKVRPGEKIAIVGTTGAGKTTIINLILRFYKHQKGQILVDGVDIEKLDIGQLRKAVGTVRQDVFLFKGSIETNIRLFNPIPEEQVQKAAKTVNASRFIEKLPLKYQEPVNQRGTTLSEGQRQLLSFARALVNDPAILVLDEATSSVDTETERLIQDGLIKLMEGRTSITIAHRLSTIQKADRILFLHKGQIREEGSHSALLKKKGLYHKLYSVQFS
ncbi:MAG: ABC transporter ATP-binding protein [Clostridia bacterium]